MQMQNIQNQSYSKTPVEIFAGSAGQFSYNTHQPVCCSDEQALSFV